MKIETIIIILLLDLRPYFKSNLSWTRKMSNSSWAKIFVRYHSFCTQC